MHLVGNSVAYQMDCMEGLKQTPDKFYELCICDPPYGGGQHFNFRFGVGDSVYQNDKPNHEYFQEIKRVSKNQIIWGGNYFAHDLPISRCWISWFKSQPLDNFSDFELAWTSFDRVSKQLNLESYGFRHSDKRNGESTIHPTQKPVALYKWLLTNYAKPGDRILDTHLGSGSHRIAAWDMGFDFWAWENDPDYFAAMQKRFEAHISKPVLFAPEEMYNFEQTKLFD